MFRLFAGAFSLESRQAGGCFQLSNHASAKSLVTFGFIGALHMSVAHPTKPTCVVQRESRDGSRFNLLGV